MYFFLQKIQTGKLYIYCFFCWQRVPSTPVFMQKFYESTEILTETGNYFLRKT